MMLKPARCYLYENRSGLYQHENGLWLRNSTERDVDIVNEQHRDYKELEELDYSGKIVLDIGGHIGCFVWFARQHLHPKLIVSIEPDPNNIWVHKRNCKGSDVVLLTGAVMPMGVHTAKLYLAPRYPSTNHVFPTRGRKEVTVSAYHLRSLLQQYKPALIKCDIEGAEFMLDWARLPKFVTEVAMEVHQGCRIWSLEKQIQLDAQFINQGFMHLRAPKHRKLFTRACTAIY